MALDLFDLRGKQALITGSSRGIGFALAGGLGRAGARIILNARNEAQLNEASEALRDAAIDVSSYLFDVTDNVTTKQTIDPHRARARPQSIS